MGVKEISKVTNQVLPERFELMYPEGQIQACVNHLGTEIQTWVKEAEAKTKKDVVCIPIMRGGFYFAADLMRRFTSSVELAPITTSSYSSSTNNTPHITVQVDTRSLDVNGRAVLLIDDICDSGRTLAVLSEKLQLAGVAEVHSAVLIYRKTSNVMHDPRWKGFSYDGPEWFVGYGMEDSGRWRNLTSVYRIRGS